MAEGFADDLDHTFVLHPELTATGTVTDADSGAPIASFKLTRGYSHILSAAIRRTRPIWELRDRFFGTNRFVARCTTGEATLLNNGSPRGRRSTGSAKTFPVGDNGDRLCCLETLCRA